MIKKYINKQIFGKKPWFAVLLVVALSLGACFDTKKSEDNTPLLLGLFLLNQPRSATATAQPTTCSETETGCRIFLTAAKHTGNLGGVLGADEKCMADSNKPASSFKFKAMIFSSEIGDANKLGRGIQIVLKDGTGISKPEYNNPSDTNNIISEDWVLKPNTKYVNKDGALITQTNTIPVLYLYDEDNGFFAFKFKQGILEATNNDNIWTGITINYPSNRMEISNKNSCDSDNPNRPWTLATGLSGTSVIYSSSSPIDFGDDPNESNCETPSRIICVEQ